MVKPNKVGHLGTLDPMATGVLLVTVGKATKLFDIMQQKEKTYCQRTAGTGGSSFISGHNGCNAIDKNSKSNLEETIGKSKISKAGTVLKIEINKKNLTGEQIRSAFSLRSSAFKITATENEVTFKVSGYGHGVGMSQYGADYMARQGSTYDEILKHYYKGSEITE